jgi:26S proteasome regulatory subunit N12
MADAQALLADLTRQVQTNDIESGKVTLTKIKIWMLDIPTNGGAAPVDSILLAANALELGVILAVADDLDMESFARNMSQLKPYYATLASHGTSSSSTTTMTTQRKCHILGLNLMHLLVHNRLSEFHAELELLTDDEASTPYVSFPITLERQLMVGSYDEVIAAGTAVPDPTYSYFMDSLLETVRDSIADCIEVSYKSMTLSDAVTMMKFTSLVELQDYLQEKREDWIVEGDSLTFQPPPMGGKAVDIPSMKLMAQSLSYATELERIV